MIKLLAGMIKIDMNVRNYTRGVMMPRYTLRVPNNSSNNSYSRHGRRIIIPLRVVLGPHGYQQCSVYEHCIIVISNRSYTSVGLPRRAGSVPSFKYTCKRLHERLDSSFIPEVGCPHLLCLDSRCMRFSLSPPQPPTSSMKSTSIRTPISLMPTRSVWTVL